MDPVQVERRIQTVSLLILATVASGAALSWLAPVLIPFVLAVFFTLALAPVVDFQTRRLRLPRWMAVLSTLVVGFVLLGLLASLVSASVGQLASNREAYQAQAAELLARLAQALPLDRFGLSAEELIAPLRSNAMTTLGGMLVGTTNAVVDLLSKSFLVLIFVVFLLVGGDDAKSRAEGTWSEILSGVERYIATKALVSAATGILVGGVLALLGIDLALVFGLFAFLLNFIPSLGSLVATLLPVPVVVMSPDISTPVAVLALVIPAAIQFAIGNVIEPRVMGRSLDLHPVAILMALIFWGMLWGIVGMLLAAPMTAILKILFEKLELTRPVAEVMAGRLDDLRGRA